MKTSSLFLSLCFSLLLLHQPAYAQEEERVISLAPSLTELMFALGAGDILVGRTTYATHPPEASKLPSVGTYYRPNLESILALQPQTVLAAPDGNPKAILESLENLGIEVLRFDPANFAALQADLQTLGKRFDRVDYATVLNARINKQLALLEQKKHEKEAARHLGLNPQPETQPPPRALLLLQLSPPIAASAQSFVGEIPNLVGMENCVQSESLYPPLSVETLLTLAPDVLLLTGMDAGDMPSGAGETPVVFQATPEQLSQMQSLWAGWANIPAVQNGHVYFLNPDIFSRPSLRLLDGLFILQGRMP